MEIVMEITLKFDIIEIIMEMILYYNGNCIIM